jgi:hypothetical protein
MIRKAISKSELIGAGRSRRRLSSPGSRISEKPNG